MEISQRWQRVIPKLLLNVFRVGNIDTEMKRRKLHKFTQVRDQLPLLWKRVMKRGKLSNENKENPGTELTVQSPMLKINKLHDKKHNKNDTSKLKPYFAKILEKIKNKQDEKMRDNWGGLITCKTNNSVAEQMQRIYKMYGYASLICTGSWKIW